MTLPTVSSDVEERPVTGRFRTPGRLRLDRFLMHRAAVFSALVLATLICATIAAPAVEILLGHGRDDVNLLNRFAGSSWSHPLGTDELGRDFLVRLLYGGRISLAVGIMAAVFAAVIGTTIGILAGWYGGWADNLLMRFTDGVIAMPMLPFLIVLAAIEMDRLPLVGGLLSGDGADLYRIVGIIALFGWTIVARLVRGATLSVRQREFVRAATALGSRPSRVMLTHVLPNVASPIVVATTLSVGNIILLESVLSFLALGVQPPTPTWGNMLTNAQEIIWSAPHLAIYPGLAIFVTVIAFNFLGDGLQDALDPRSQTDRA
ncbi:ABC transporter permease [Fodinicurvata sp. EGI_FJ10296]|uniref:ABC transporter permease n=1 Tax=Fodinicurvata sp. EGI_FJ10296 TaxID=3231908 RepID=UPI0034512280